MILMVVCCLRYVVAVARHTCGIGMDFVMGVFPRGGTPGGSLCEHSGRCDIDYHNKSRKQIQCRLELNTNFNMALILCFEKAVSKYDCQISPFTQPCSEKAS